MKIPGCRTESELDDALQVVADALKNPSEVAFLMGRPQITF